MMQLDSLDPAAVAGRADEGLFARVARRWWIVAAVTAAAIVVAIVYLAVATPVYNVTAVLVAEHARPVSAGDVPPDEFMSAQRALVLSSAPEARRGDLQIKTDKGAGTIAVVLPSADPQSAAVALNATCDAYLKAYTQQQSTASSAFAELSAERDRKAAAREAATKALLDFRAAGNLAAGEVDNAAVARVAQLQAALKAAQSEAEAADTEAKAVIAAATDPQKLQQLIINNRGKGIFADLEQQRAKARADLDKLEPQLAQQRQTLLSQHPTLIQTERKVAQLQQQIAEIDKRYPEVFIAHVRKRRDDAQKKVAELKRILGEQSPAPTAAAGNTARLAELEAAIKRADAELADADKKLRETIAGGDSSGTTMKLVQPPTVPAHPSSPRRRRVLTISAAAGMLAGLALAVVAAPPTPKPASPDVP